MRRCFIAVMSAAALFAVAVAPATADSDAVDRYYQLQATGVVTLTPEGLTHTSDIAGSEVVVNALGEVVDRVPFRAKVSDRPLGQSIAQVPCVHDTKNREGFTAYLPPAVYSIDNKNEKGSFSFNLYSQDHARENQFHQPTVQILSCAAGGVDAENGSRITISGPGMAFNDARTPRILGRNWREGETPKDYSISLGFQVPRDAVTITGGIQQNPSNSLKGSVVPPYGYGDMEQYHLNAVNAWWEEGCRPHCRRWNGSADYQGSVGEGLWEFPQAYKSEALSRGFKIAGYMEHFCGNPFGC
jgi:hypothetical protein